MRGLFTVMLAAVLVSSPALAQTNPTPTTDHAVAASLVQKAVMRALNFDRGDAASLKGARVEFTREGWTAYMKHLDGWLDAGGAPTFSSSFVPSGDPTVVSQGDGVFHVTIPGTLKHSQNGSSTTYRVVVDVRASGKPMKIESLKQTTCGGPTAKPCK
jgi:hypothetical protein